MSIWLWGMFTLWYYAQKYNLIREAGRELGVYRNILDIADAVHDRLGSDTSAYSDADLMRRIRHIELVVVNIAPIEKLASA